MAPKSRPWRYPSQVKIGPSVPETDKINVFIWKHLQCRLVSTATDLTIRQFTNANKVTIFRTWTLNDPAFTISTRMYRFIPSARPVASCIVLLTFKCVPVFVGEVVVAFQINLFLKKRDHKRFITTYYNFKISPWHFDSFRKIDLDWFFCSVTEFGKISQKSVLFCIWNCICHLGFCARHTKQWRIQTWS